MTSAVAWSNHSLGTYVSLKEMPEIKAAIPVEVESLESFLQKEKNQTHPFIQSLMKLDKDVTYGDYSHAYSRNVIAKESKERSDRLDYLLRKTKEIHWWLIRVRRGTSSYFCRYSKMDLITYRNTQLELSLD